MTQEFKKRIDGEKIGAILRVALSTYEMGVRQTGRTTKLIETLKEQDIFVVHTASMRRHVQGKLIEMRKGGIFVIDIPVDKDVEQRLIELMSNRHGYRGKIVFDHHWVIKFYEEMLYRAERLLEDIDSKLNPHEPGK